MNRRGFFAKFSAVVAAVPIIGKLVRRKSSDYVFMGADFSESAWGSVTIAYRIGKNGCYSITKIDGEPITDGEELI